MAELPPDIIFCNILPRFPAKSLLRFKCVSKEWHSFQNTHLFQKLHLHHAIATNEDHQNNLKTLVFSNKIPRAFKVMIDCEALEDGLTASRPFPFKADSKNNDILASFAGLVCSGIRANYSNRYSELILWNPLTGDYKTLSKPINSIKDFYCQLYYKQRAFGLYYSSCDHDFKLLCITYSLDAYIYSLKSDTWRKIDSSTEDLKRIVAYPYAYPAYRLWPSITLNENLYFLKLGYDKTRCSIIIRFDTKTETFTEIATPSLRLFTEIGTPCFHFGNEYDVFLSLTVLGGRIHFFAINHMKSHPEWHVECWSMDEDGNWIEELTLPKTCYIIASMDPGSNVYTSQRELH